MPKLSKPTINDRRREQLVVNHAYNCYFQIIDSIKKEGSISWSSIILANMLVLYEEIEATYKKR